MPPLQQGFQPIPGDGIDGGLTQLGEEDGPQGGAVAFLVQSGGLYNLLPGEAVLGGQAVALQHGGHPGPGACRGDAQPLPHLAGQHHADAHGLPVGEVLEVVELLQGMAKGVAEV